MGMSHVKKDRKEWAHLHVTLTKTILHTCGRCACMLAVPQCLLSGQNGIIEQCFAEFHRRPSHKDHM